MADDPTALAGLLPDFAALMADPGFQASLDERDATAKASEVRRSQQRRREAIAQAGLLVPTEDVEAIALGTVRDTMPLRLVRRFLDAVSAPRNGKPSPRFLVLLGDRGIGKTMACAWAVAEIGQGLAVGADDLGRELSAFKRDSLVERIMRARLLVVDDLGTESRDMGSALFDVVNRRAAVPYALTMFTSNLTKDELVAKYDARIIERITARGYIGSIKGENLRKPLGTP